VISIFPAGSIAADATRRRAMSALPDAPVVEDVNEPAGVRVALAAVLRGVAAGAGRAAERLEPRHLRVALNR
jgi:hypothetical protein